MEELGPNVFAIMVHAHDQPGVLHDLTEVISAHRANIAYVDITERHEGVGSTYFELEDVTDSGALMADLSHLRAVIDVEDLPSFWKLRQEDSTSELP